MLMIYLFHFSARSLSFHFILAVIVQTLLLPVTIGLIVGVAKVKYTTVGCGIDFVI